MLKVQRSSCYDLNGLIVVRAQSFRALFLLLLSRRNHILSSSGREKRQPEEGLRSHLRTCRRQE